DPVCTLDKARKLVEYDKVNFIIGPLDGSSRRAVEPYLAEHKVPNFPNSFMTEESKKHGWTFLL
ncbi:unnamed protein product, partial [marine sediment metagenome]